MKKYIAIPLMLLCCACSRGKYYVTDTFRMGAAGNIQFIEIDSSYYFYKREVYKDKDENSQNILRSNVSKTDTATKIRIEVEYLLISLLHKNAIYITTVPDKFQYYYSEHMLPDSVINAYDFSAFYFGKLNNDGEFITFVAENGIKKMRWQLRPSLANAFPKQLFLRELEIEKKDVLSDVILVERALQVQVVFTKQAACSIIFARPDATEQSEASLIKNRLADGRIYFYQSKHGIDILLRFSNNINTQDSAIGFNHKRTLYDPFPLTGSSN
jgi:hypothetical protein